MSVITRVHDIVDPLVSSLGLELFDIEQAGPVLRISVDRPGGVDLDLIAKATRIISRELDASDPISGRYTLEVSSPGLERPLKKPSHFERFVGTEVTIKLGPHVEVERRLRGVITAADDSSVTVRTDDGDRTIEYTDIVKARTVFEWATSAKPGGPPAETTSAPVAAAMADDRRTQR